MLTITHAYTEMFPRLSRNGPPFLDVYWIAQIGATLASLFQQGMTYFTQANNALMKGLPFGNQDIRGYLSGGAYLTGPNPNITAITQTANTLLASAAINQLWKHQKIFIIGGGPCDDSGGIGAGPQEAKLCKNNQAWYLFYWQEYLGHIELGKKQWGNVAAPPGMDTLAGQGITIQVSAGLICTRYSAAYYTHRMLSQHLLMPSLLVAIIIRQNFAKIGLWMLSKVLRPIQVSFYRALRVASAYQ